MLADPNPEKIRIRSDLEREIQLIGLLEVCKVLNSCGLRWFVSGGTLLGAVRDGDFIPWDWDVEVTVFTEQALPLRNALVERLSDRGFQMIVVDDSSINFKVVAEGFGTKYEILGLRLERNKVRARRVLVVSARLFDDQEFVLLRGHTFPAPKPAVAYLEEVYGDWQTPKRTSVKSDYLAPSSQRKPRFAYRLRHLVTSAPARLRIVCRKVCDRART